MLEVVESGFAAHVCGDRFGRDCIGFNCQLLVLRDQAASHEPLINGSSVQHRREQRELCQAAESCPDLPRFVRSWRRSAVGCRVSKVGRKNLRARGAREVGQHQQVLRGIWSAYVQYYLDSLETPQLVRLAAFAVSGQTVDLNGTFDGNLKWSKLRDSSLCLLIPRISSKSGEHDVRVPYALLVNIGSRREELVTDAERNFASALNDMRDEVDSTMFKLQPWQSWEMFGACFYAVRINALLALGHSTVTLRNLLPGTLMSGKTSAITVILVPSKVIRCAGAFGASTPPLIPRKGNRLETIDWLHCSE